MTHSWELNLALWILATGFQKERKKEHKWRGKILNFIQELKSLKSKIPPIGSVIRPRMTSYPPPLKGKPYCWKFHIWKSGWVSKHLPADLLKILVCFLMSKVFFPVALLFVKEPVPVPVLFCLRCREANERQGKCSLRRGKRGQKAKQSPESLTPRRR